MRKFFIGTMLVSLLTALVVGAVLAWTGTTPTITPTATAGEAAATAYNWVPTGNKVVPTNTAIKVGDGGITNTGDIAVYVTGGNVSNILTGDATCNAYITGGGVSGAVAVTNSNWIVVGAQYAPLYDVSLTMGLGAPNACQNQTIWFDLTVDVSS